MGIISIIGLALGPAWTSGINLYATVAVLGLVQKLGWARLPGGLAVLDNWVIIGVGAGLFCIEFFADKIPYVDSIWDAIHTFIRVPAGAVLAFAATTELNPVVQVIAVLLGGGLALSSHGTKSALRATANLSPEPVSNWILSLIEDFIAIAGSLLAVFAPILILIAISIFLLIFAWILPKVVRRIKRMIGTVAGLFRRRPAVGRA
ncbi:MAG: DUF4126 domain-containing protein [Pyrinomonadaceae bacterium]